MKNTRKRTFEIITHYTGSLIVLISIIFLGFKLLKYRKQLIGFHFGLPHLVLLVIGPFFFVLGCFILTRAWERLLIFLGEREVPHNVCVGIYARANIAKYLPGNIFHFAGRHVLGLKNGFSNVSLGVSLVLEIAGLTLGTSIIGVLGGAVFGIDRNIFDLRWTLVLMPCLCLLTYLGLKFFSIVFADRFRALPVFTVKSIVGGLLPVLWVHILFLCLIGGILAVTVAVLSEPISIYEAGMVIAVFAVAWMAGLLTPGAPAGIGVREAIIIALLGTMVSESDSIMIAFTFRIITTLGDLLFWGVGFLQPYKVKT